MSTKTYTGRFAVRLRELREKAGLSIEQLSEKTGISQRTLYSWESATRSPVIDRFPELSEALGVKIHKLLPEK